MKKIIMEEFSSIKEMLETIFEREKNEVMMYYDSSTKNGKDFTGTKSMEEALELLTFGDKEKYELIIQNIRTSGITRTLMLPKRQIRTGVVGYAPNVPNAIMGLPNSMIYTDKPKMKSKVISLLYSVCENAMVLADELTKSGVAILNTINALELSGYRIELNILFFNGYGVKEKTRASVNLKKYNEHLDLLKLAFPFANPSMLRRFGFKWLETLPELTDTSYQGGYGHNNEEDLSDDKTVYLNYDMVRDEGYDAVRIIEKYFKKYVN